MYILYSTPLETEVSHLARPAEYISR